MLNEYKDFKILFLNFIKTKSKITDIIIVNVLPFIGCYFSVFLIIMKSTWSIEK